MNKLELQTLMWMKLRSVKLQTVSKKKINKGKSTVLENKRKLKTWHEKALMSGWLMEYQTSSKL